MGKSVFGLEETTPEASEGSATKIGEAIAGKKSGGRAAEAWCHREATSR